MPLSIHSRSPTPPPIAQTRLLNRYATHIYIYANLTLKSLPIPKSTAAATPLLSVAAPTKRKMPLGKRMRRSTMEVPGASWPFICKVKGCRVLDMAGGGSAWLQADGRRPHDHVSLRSLLIFSGFFNLVFF